MFSLILLGTIVGPDRATSVRDVCTGGVADPGMSACGRVCSVGAGLKKSRLRSLNGFLCAGLFKIVYLEGMGGRKRERNINVRKEHQSVASCMRLNRYQTHNQACVYSNQELNRKPFILLTEPHWSGSGLLRKTPLKDMLTDF